MMNQITLRLLLIIAFTMTTQVSDNQAEAWMNNQIRVNNEILPINKVNEMELGTAPSDTDKNQAQTVTVTSTKEADKTGQESAPASSTIEEWLQQLPKIEGETEAATFINTIGPAAVVIAAENGIYPSVMIAQAGLESAWGTSGLAQKYNNLMGTKGAWEGNSVTMSTNEEFAGEQVQIDAGFSVYHSWADSLSRYGQLMRDGLEWDANFYQGTWRENTESYQEATAWLVGRYATDSAYADKLNATIEKYNLNQFDEFDKLNVDYQEYLTELTVDL